MIIFLVGTSADFLKIIPVASRLKAAGRSCEIWSTSQQVRDLTLVCRELGLKVDRDLMQGKSTRNLQSIPGAIHWLSRLTTSVVRNRSRLLEGSTSRRGRSCLIVHGDTLTAAWGVLLARFLGLDLIHLEAGLRSGRVLDPFPEEIVRRWISFFALINFAPDRQAGRNLQRVRGEIVVTHGNTIIDTLTTFGSRGDAPILEGLEEAYVLVSLHRSELLRSKSIFTRTMQQIRDLSNHRRIIMIVDTQTDAMLSRLKLTKFVQTDNIRLVSKLPYGEFIHVLRKALYVITDSGGLQEECAAIGKPCLVHRRATERRDGLGLNAVLSGWTSDAISDFDRTFTNYSGFGTSLIGTSPSTMVVEELMARAYG